MTCALTDLGNAERLINTHGADLRFVPAWGTWLIWDGTRWQRDTTGRHVSLATETIRSIPSEARDLEDHEQRKAILKWAVTSENVARVRALVELARTQRGTPVEPDQLDADPWKLNTPTGTVNLRTGELGAAEPKDLITKRTTGAYDPAATCPTFDRFLEQILPDPDVREFVTRWFGYTLTGLVTEQKILFGVGAGANGKSTLFEVIAGVLGDYARQAAPDLLMKRHDDPHPTGLADLQGARLVLASETAQGRKLDEGLVKRLTGGDRIKARMMHRDFFEFDPSHKFVVATNHKPTIDGTDHGIWRRVRLVPFAVTIADDLQDRHLADKLRREAPGILAWAVQGCLRWQSGGLTEPSAVVAATADYRAESDLLGAFISDQCLLLNNISARASDLLEEFNTWANTNGERPMSARKLGAALLERGLERYTNNGTWYRGIGIRQTAPDRITEGTE